ncbi:glycosyltransferase family 2 protein [Maricaulis sp.]|uniref:glycosyltransferase family 2 protein n=1 Tax=Maricaulis sp. TaxID=1486257 RepID=UPI002637D764|nr:glycosyltransferase family 2 protein [Maricaulis sp.]
MSEPTTDYRRPSHADTPLRASVVIAVLDEAENVAAVCEETLRGMERAGAFEIVFVDDGSADATPQILQDIAGRDPRVRLVRHDRRCGKSQAVRSGVLAARAPWIATLDGDGQNDPDDLPDMLDKAWSGEGLAPLVAGTRVRRDDPLSRLIATRIANGFRSWVLGDHCPDTGCGVKVFHRDSFLLLPCFEGMHRFLPALFQRYGHPLINHPVKHRARAAGSSKYTNWGRALVGIFDTMGVIWLVRRTRAPGRIEERQPKGPGA